MLSIQNNLLAINANRNLRVNGKNTAKTTEKLSSGYRINRAADDAAGLAISEKMRRQIRGLTQGTLNAQDGVSFVKVADGAMDEIHGMLQRMNELTIKSLNDTCTESDRAALDAEFDQLRTEMDRINLETEFNEQPVFEEHEPSYYQLAGNRKWDDNQLHTVASAENELYIHLPDNYSPNEFTLSVPAGVYTTQELIDEIDDAMYLMKPFNPGFVLEYTGEGYCNLNFESPQGQPTEISLVDGPLSYLLYDSYVGNSSISLLGTNGIDAGYPLQIVKGQNDQLGFYIESKDSMDFVSLTISSNSGTRWYTREELIKEINDQLAKNPKCSGVTAKEYGDSCVQITGGTDKSITGLSGNMFTIEKDYQTPYTGAFYDNVSYGNSGGTNATIRGSAFYQSGVTAEIAISAQNNNNTLRFKLNDAADYMEVTIPDGEYTMSQLASKLNEQFKGFDVSATTVSEYTSSGYRYYLKIDSTVKGSKSALVFDQSAGVYGNTYADLFLNTRYHPVSSSGSSGYNAAFFGSKTLSSPINLSASDSLSFSVDGTAYTINNIGGTYTDASALADKLNECIKGTAIEGKVKFNSSGNRLRINGLTNDVKSINFGGTGQKNKTYNDLFVGKETVVRNGNFTTQSGYVEKKQGVSTPISIKDATIKITIPADKRTTPISIDGKSNKLSFSVGGSSQVITLPSKTYSNIANLVTEINNQFKSSGDDRLKNMKAEYSNGTLTFTSTPTKTAPNGIWSTYVPTSTYDSDYGTGYQNYAWKDILGTEIKDISPSSQTSSKGYPATLTSKEAIPGSVTIDGSNCKLSITIDGVSDTIEIAQGTYNKVGFEMALEAAINKSAALQGKDVKAEILDNGKLRFSATGSSLKASPAGSSFYKDILMDTESASKPYSYVGAGSYQDGDYSAPYIIGRKDLTEEPIEIVAGANDIFTFDFSHTSFVDTSHSYKKTMDITIPEGVYEGDALAEVLEKEIQKKFEGEGLNEFDIQVSVGGINTGVVNAIDDVALQIVVNRKTGKNPGETPGEPGYGQYVLDGVRGSAASFIFYKTNGKPKETYIVGTKDLSDGITFKPGQNVLTLTADDVPYSYTFPENAGYTAEEFAKKLNDMFTNGDDNGNKAPLEASIENGALKISHKAPGSHTITDIGGSAKSLVFLQESGRSSRKPMIILVGAESGDTIEIPRTRVGTCALKVNSVTLSKPKYATKALKRVKHAISALSMRRSTYGAMQNRLEHTVNNNNNVIENTTASESLIRDADVSRETMEQAKNSIMEQAANAMLAQANQFPNHILTLLQ